MSSFLIAFWLEIWFIAKYSCGVRFDTLRYLPVGVSPPVDRFGSRIDTELDYMFWELVFVLLIVYFLDYCLTVCIRRYRDYRVLVNIIPLAISRRGGPKARAKAALRR